MKALFLILLMIPVGAHAGGLLRENFEGVRSAGMGNAYVALADDSNALWQNPAGLAFIKGNHFNLIDATLAVDSYDTLKRCLAMVFNNDAANFLRLDTQYQAFSFRPTFTRKYLGISLYNNMAGFFDTSFANYFGVNVPNADVYAYNDTGVIAGLGFPITPYFSLGASARLFMRTAIDANVTAQDLFAQLGIQALSTFETAIYDYLKSLAGVGYGIGLNVGTLVKIPLGAKNAPTLQLAGVVEDVGTTQFTALTTSFPAAPAINTNYIAGAGVIWPMSKDSRLSLTAELRHMFEPIHFVKSAHVGLEYKHRFFGLRGGYSEGYFTYGASWELLPHTRVHVASYAKELGDGYNERSQRWYVVQAIIGFAPF